MSLFISNALAQAQSTTPAGEPGLLMNLLPLLLIFAVFYVFLIRPQQKKLKEHEAVINSIKRGDEVVTGGGIIGKVSKIEEGSNVAFVEISEGVVVRINKATIIDVISADKVANSNSTQITQSDAPTRKNKNNKKGS